MILKNGKRIDGLGDNMPIGSIVEYNGTDIPDGWEILPGDANVYVGLEQPTEGQEVWVQRSKNMFNKDESIIYGRTLNSAGGYDGIALHFVQDCYIEVEPNKVYTLSIGEQFIPTNYTQGRIAVHEYDSTHTFIHRLIDRTETYMTFTTTSNTHYIKVCAPIDALYSVQVTEGAEILPYTPYARKIFIKVGDNLYKEIGNSFYPGTYTQGETRIGTWFNGKPLYRSMIDCGYLNTGFQTINHGIPNIEILANARGFFSNVNTGTWFPIPRAYPTEMEKYGVAVDAGKESIYLTSGTNFDGTTFYAWIILEYTKTTD